MEENYIKIKELETLEKKRSYTIAMSNTIIDEMRNNLKAQQVDILNFMLKEIKPEDKPEKEYTITIADYCQVANITNHTNSNNYKNIKKSLWEINSINKWVRDAEEAINRSIRWFDMLEIHEKDNTIHYSFHRGITPYLFNLVKEGHYTKWTFKESALMNSKYSKKLYVVLLRSLGVGFHAPLLSIDKLRNQLGCVECQLRFADFERNVIQTAIDEINRYTALKVSFKPYKEAGSRKYTHIQFYLTKLTRREKEFEKREQNLIDGYGVNELYELPF